MDHETTQSDMLDKQADDHRNVDRLIAKCRTTTYYVRHDDAWRNELAADLNAILSRVEWTLETDGCDVDVEFAEAALRVVERVATFEEIKTCA